MCWWFWGRVEWVVLDLGGCAARDWDPWCLVYLHDWRVSFFFFSFFPYLFFILSRPLGGCFLLFSPLTFTSCYTLLKTSMIKTQLNPGAPLPLLASIGPLSIEACCEVALALNKAHSQWKLGRICDPPRHGHGHGPAMPGQAQLTSSQPTATANASTLQNMFHFFLLLCLFSPLALFTASRLVSNRV